MSGCGYTICILATPKKGGHPNVDIRILSSSYPFLEWLNEYLPDTKNNSDNKTASLRTQYDTKTLNINKDITSEQMYDELILVLLKAHCMETSPASVSGKNNETEDSADEISTKEILEMPLVKMAYRMLEHKKFINWKKNSVHIWITNTAVMF